MVFPTNLGNEDRAAFWEKYHINKIKISIYVTLILLDIFEFFYQSGMEYKRQIWDAHSDKSVESPLGSRVHCIH